MSQVINQKLVLKCNKFIETYTIDDMINEIEKAYDIRSGIDDQFEEIEYSHNDVLKVMHLFSSDQELTNIVNSAENEQYNKSTKEKYKVFIEDYINSMILVYLNSIKNDGLEELVK